LGGWSWEEELKEWVWGFRRWPRVEMREGRAIGDEDRVSRRRELRPGLKGFILERMNFTHSINEVNGMDRVNDAIVWFVLLLKDKRGYRVRDRKRRCVLDGSPHHRQVLQNVS